MKEKGTYALERALVHVFQHNVDGAVTNEKTLASNDTKKKERQNTATIRSCGTPLNNYILERFGHGSPLRLPKYSAKEKTIDAYFNSYVLVEVTVIK